MNWLKNIISILLVVVVLWAEALYVTNESATCSWDPSEGATKYEVQAVWQGATGDKQIYNLGETTDTIFVIYRPRAGAFEIRVRAGDGTVWSTWSKSTDPAVATVDGVPRGWRIQFELPAPGGGGVS